MSEKYRTKYNIYVFTSSVHPSYGMVRKTFIGLRELSWIVDEMRNIATVLLIRRKTE